MWIVATSVHWLRTAFRNSFVLLDVVVTAFTLNVAVLHCYTSHHATPNVHVRYNYQQIIKSTSCWLDLSSVNCFFTKLNFHFISKRRNTRIVIFDGKKHLKDSEISIPRLVERDSRSTWADHDVKRTIVSYSLHVPKSRNTTRVHNRSSRITKRKMEKRGIDRIFLLETLPRAVVDSRWRTSNDNQPLQHRCFRFVKARVDRDVDQIVYDSTCASIL